MGHGKGQSLCDCLSKKVRAKCNISAQIGTSRPERTKGYARFINKLREARHEAGLLQIDVAKKLKRPQSYISRVESGEYRLDILEVKRFAKLYKKDINYFIK